MNPQSNLLRGTGTSSSWTATTPTPGTVNVAWNEQDAPWGAPCIGTVSSIRPA